MDLNVDSTLDCRGLACPMPVLKTKKAIDELQIGQVLKLTATDAGSEKDIPAWASRTGHQLIGSERDGDNFIFYIKKAK